MTPMEYEDEKRKIREEYDRKIKNLNEHYALESNPYMIGDIITSDKGLKIVVDHIMYSFISTPYPQNLYKGRIIQDDGTLTTLLKGSILQSGVVDSKSVKMKVRPK